VALNLHLVRVFSAVADHGSFSRAAEALHVSQPAVSRGVAELERQVGTPLLDRSGRRVTTTDAGALLHEHAVRLFAIERSAENALAEVAGLARGQLTIGASTTIGIYLLPAVLGTFHRRHPGIRLVLDIGNTAQVVERLRTAPLDAAFVEGPVDGPDLEVAPWRPDRLVVVAAPGHPLGGRGPVAIDALMGELFVLRERGSGTRDVVDEALRHLGREVRVAMELGSTEAVKQAVAASLGVSIIPVATIGQELALGRLAVLDVPELHVTRTLSRVTVAGRPASRALEAFLELAGHAMDGDMGPVGAGTLSGR
jgi:DNA-binding transcriptional LysR family regulator